MRSEFEFAGRVSSDFYLTVEKLPSISIPAKKYQTVSIPGRNGDLHVEERTFKNYTQPYKCWFRDPNMVTREAAHAISEWLLSTHGTQVLRDSYDPEHFRKATFLDSINIEHLLNEYGRCTINFDCAPQAFLNSGERVTILSKPGQLRNPTAFTALPRITVYGTGPGTLIVGNTTVNIKTLTDFVILDSDTQNAFRTTDGNALENRNGTIYAPVFPELIAGDNQIRWTGEINRVEIIPRWWTV